MEIRIREALVGLDLPDEPSCRGSPEAVDGHNAVVLPGVPETLCPKRLSVGSQQ